MMNVLYAVAVLGILGGVFGVVLAVASRVFAVEADERLEQILQILPGANCGGCGFAGCSVYAEAIISGGDVNRCPVGGGDSAQKIADIMGIQTTKNTRLVALVKCRGADQVKKKGRYYGINNCEAAMKVAGNGPSECAYGCLGFGTCVAACPFDAIYMADGVARVNHEKCTGCLVCVSACPRNVIVPAPYEADITVACSSKERGGVLRSICNIGCIGCKICEKTCQHDAIHVEDNLAVIDYEKCVSCSECAAKCPRKLIADANLRNEFNTVEPASR